MSGERLVSDKREEKDPSPFEKLIFCNHQSNRDDDNINSLAMTST